MGLLRNRHLIGAVFVMLLAGSVWLTSAIFSNKFVDYDEVTLKSSNLGLQLPKNGDIKIRGVQVGEVLDFTSDGSSVEVTLGFYPDKIDIVPANVTAEIEPKTLFGEKYVALVPPEQPSKESIQAGDTIEQTVVRTQVEETLNDLYPLLRAIQPAELNTTLNSISTALEGRGDKIRGAVTTLDAYLGRMNPELPALVQGLRRLGRTSDLYADVLPDLAVTLRNVTTTGKTLEGREARLRRLLRDVNSFSGTARDFLDTNGDNLIRVNQLAARTLRVLAKYAPEFPCLTKGLETSSSRYAEAFRGFTLHINLELIPPTSQPRPYGPQDAPRYGDKRGPHCGTLPNSPYNQTNIAPYPINGDDGVDEDTGKGTMRPGVELGDRYAETRAPAGSPEEATFIKGLLAVAEARGADQVSDMSVLLAAPLLRGAEVSLR